MTRATKAYEEQARTGYAAGLFVARYLAPADRAYSCPKCSEAMHPRAFGDTENGVGLYGFACNRCRTLMLAEADNCIDAAEKLGVLA